MDLTNLTKGGVQKKIKKRCNIVTTYVGRRAITPNLLIFFMVPIHPNLQRNLFLGWGWGRWGGGG